MTHAAPGSPQTRTWGRLALALLLAAIVTAGIALFAANHKPDYTFNLFGSNAIDVKSKIATAIVAGALVQLLLALWIYGKIPGLRAAPRPVGRVHRVIGFVVFLATIPVAIHCIAAYGFSTTNARTTLHSFFGCFFYGAFAAKVTVVRSRRLPGWVLPVVGGVLVTIIVIVWYLSAVWFFSGYNLPS